MFTYWTDAIDDTATTPNSGHDTNPNLVYSPAPPATANPPAKPDTVAPAPWVPFTRAGCNVGEIATVNQELENPSPDIPNAFGANSPEAQQLAADPDSFKDPETADYIGIGRALRQGQRVLRRRAGGQVRADHPLATRPWPTCCRTSRAATPASRRCSGTGTSRRSWAAAPPT